MTTITALQIAVALLALTSAFFAMLWQIEKAEAKEQSKAAEHFERAAQINATELTKWRRECEELSAKLLSKQGKLDIANRNLNRAYIRNSFGVWQRFREWEAIGDKKPIKKQPNA